MRDHIFDKVTPGPLSKWSIPNPASSALAVPWLMLLVPYSFAFGLSLFFLDAAYWDDWILRNLDQREILRLFLDAGSAWGLKGYLHVLMLAAGEGFYRLAVLALGFLCGVVLWKILATIREISVNERFWLVLLFLVAPFNPARFALINFPSYFCFTLFVLAWYYLTAKDGIGAKCIALLLFLFSFDTPSLLVFYLLPIAHACYMAKVPMAWKGLVRFGLRNMLFLLAPFGYFWVSARYFQASGSYTGHNAIRSEYAAALLGILLLAILLAYVCRNCVKYDWNRNRWLLYFLGGLFITWLAVFPYIAVGKLPSFGDWNSRFQLLMPLGGAVILVGIGLFVGRVERFCLLATIVSVCACAGFMAMLALDWWKQKEVIRLFAHSEEIRSAKTIVIIDQAKQFNAFDRTYRPYELNGWLREAFGDESRLAVSDLDIDWSMPIRTPEQYHDYPSSQFNCRKYIWSEPDLIVTIRYPGVNSRFWKVVNVLAGKKISITLKRIPHRQSAALARPVEDIELAKIVMAKFGSS